MDGGHRPPVKKQIKQARKTKEPSAVPYSVQQACRGAGPSIHIHRPAHAAGLVGLAGKRVAQPWPVNPLRAGRRARVGQVDKVPDIFSIFFSLRSSLPRLAVYCLLSTLVPEKEPAVTIGRNSGFS
jgi:hypothetical protein